MDSSTLLAEFVEDAARKLDGDVVQISRCVGMLSEDQAWHRVNAHCNSVANLLLHLRGNVGQWILGGVGGGAMERDRPAEFSERGPRPVAPILAALQATVAQAAATIRAITPAELAEPREIQGYRVSVMHAIFHVAEHFSFHTGQIVHMTKALLDVDLSLYDPHGRRLAATNTRPW
jgi:uncharacterized damage-inducible protein DinB